jgi:hypothetical protein
MRGVERSKRPCQSRLPEDAQLQDGAIVGAHDGNLSCALSLAPAVRAHASRSRSVGPEQIGAAERPGGGAHQPKHDRPAMAHDPGTDPRHIHDLSRSRCEAAHTARLPFYRRCPIPAPRRAAAPSCRHRPDDARDFTAPVRRRHAHTNRRRARAARRRLGLTWRRGRDSWVELRNRSHPPTPVWGVIWPRISPVPCPSECTLA